MFPLFPHSMAEKGGSGRAAGHPRVERGSLREDKAGPGQAELQREKQPWWHWSGASLGQHWFSRLCFFFFALVGTMWRVLASSIASDRFSFFFLLTSRAWDADSTFVKSVVSRQFFVLCWSPAAPAVGIM